jgi:hypothetical protein
VFIAAPIRDLRSGVAILPCVLGPTAVGTCCRTGKSEAGQSIEDFAPPRRFGLSSQRADDEPPRRPFAPFFLASPGAVSLRPSPTPATWHILAVGRDLLEDWTVPIRYGRIGQHGQERRHAASEPQAMQAVIGDRLRRRLFSPETDRLPLPARCS